MPTSTQDRPESTDRLPPPRARLRWLLAAGLAGIIAAVYFSGLHQFLSWQWASNLLDGWRASVHEHPIPTLAVFIGLYVAVTALSIPVATWLTLLAGALFGRWVGTAVVSLASTAGATLAFLLSRYLFRDWVQFRFGDRLGPVNRGVEKDGAFYLFTLRLTPMVPFWLINLGMALTPIRVGTFAAVSWLGMLPATAIYVNAGTALGTLKEPADILSPTVIVSLALLGLAPLAFRLLVRRLRK